MSYDEAVNRSPSGVRCCILQLLIVSLIQLLCILLPEELRVVHRRP